MIVGLGVDLLENRRVEQELERGEWLADDGIFSADEIARAYASGNPARELGACFAGKEAALKALGREVNDLGYFRELDVHLGNGSESRLELKGRLKQETEQMGVRHIRLSVTLTTTLTGAMVILED